MARKKNVSSTARRHPEVLVDLHSQVDNADDEVNLRRLAAQRYLSAGKYAPPADPSTGDSLLLALPAEIRTIIYEYVFSTGIVDVSTGSRVIVVQEFWQSNFWDTSGRKHDYHCRGSFDYKQLSILSTRRGMRGEALPLFWPKTVLRFYDEDALMHFVGIKDKYDRDRDVAQRNSALLLQARKVECDIPTASTAPPRLEQLKAIAQQLDQPVDVVFVDTTIEKGIPKTRKQLKAAERWHVHMMEMKGKIHAKQRMTDSTVTDWIAAFKDDKRATKHYEPIGENSLLPKFLVY